MPKYGKYSLKKEHFTCIGNSYPGYTISEAGVDMHPCYDVPWWHNVYAGPFCITHLQMWSEKMLTDHNSKHDTNYVWSDPREEMRRGTY